MIKRTTKTITVGDSEYLHSSVATENEAISNVSWSSSDTEVITVNPTSGLVYAQSEGTSVISVIDESSGNVIESVNYTITAPVLVSEIILSHSELKLVRWDRFVISAIVLPENAANKSLCWTSSDPRVVVFEKEGRIFCQGVGRALITVFSKDGSHVSATCRIEVMQDTHLPREKNRNTRYDELSKVADPIDVYTGAHIIDNTVMSLFGGQNLKVTAHYNSTDLVVGEMGSGWYHNFEKFIDIDGCEARVYESPTNYVTYYSDCDSSNSFTSNNLNKSGYVLTVDHTQQYPYILNCNYESTEYYDAEGRIAKITNHQGFETLVSYSDNLITITDGVSGKKMYLEKNSAGRVTRVYDDAGRQAVLTYDGDLLTSICDVNGNTLTYTYECGKIKTGTDSNGVTYFENTYDEFGRVCEQKDAIPGTPKSIFVYDGLKRITTNRCGKQCIREYDENGLLIKFTDENSNVTTYEYDDRCNMTKETDARGNSVIKSYNSLNKPTEITDKNGYKTTVTYDEVGNIVKITYPPVSGVIPEETFVYNDKNQMTQHTDVRGTVTVYTYDTNGMPATKKVGSRGAITYSYENGLLKSQTDALGHTTTYTHNTIGQIATVKNADNKTTTYTYDNSGHVLATTDANGKTVTNTYDCNYQLTSATDANGNRTEYSYNGNLKNDVITQPDGKTVRHQFDAEDRIVKIIDQAGAETNITYDDCGRVISRRFADGAIVQYEYDAVDNVVKETNPKGGVTTRTYDKKGNVLSVKDNEGNTTTYEYNAMSKLVKVTNAFAGSTVYEYSKAGDLLSETDPLGNKKTYTYDAYGNRLSAKDAKNNITTYTYDDHGNLLTVKDAMNNITTYTYNCLNQCVSVKDAKNNTITYGYDALGRRTTITDARGNTFTTFYDAVGNVVKTTDAKGNVISETMYNCLNLPLAVKDSMGKTTSYTYNDIGKVASVTDALSHRSEYTYNSRGQNTSVLDAANGTSCASYDLLGNITTLRGPLGGTTSYTYDAMGRRTSESTSSGGTVAYTYNELNIRKKITNARGQDRQFFYDAAGRVTGCTTPEGSISYTYDANGNVLTVTDSNGTVTRTYDALNRVSSYTDTYGKTIHYGYDEVGNLTTLVYPDNTIVRYTYDVNHNLLTVTDWANRVTSYTYDANNRVVGVTKPDGSVTTTAYDNMQRVTSTVERTAGGTVITGFEYTYDDLSRIVEEKVLANSTKMCYTYDSLGRVTKRTTKNLSDVTLYEENYSYDAAGNIIGDTANLGFSYDTNNRLVMFNGRSISYDLDGNMTSDYCTAYSYDSANRLLHVDGHMYTYNAEDVRICNHSAASHTTYTYDTNRKLSRLLEKTTNSVTTKYVYGHGLICEETNSTIKTYHFDNRGSTVAITDASGAIVDTITYDTYGMQTSHIGTSDVIFAYNGRDGVITDNNDLIYMRARYYSPVMRRFINADILHGSISDSTSLNRYSYVNGNPVSFVDPFGLERGPTTLEAAYMAQHIYDPYNLNGSNFPLINDWQLFYLLEEDNGFCMGVYYRKVNGSTHEVEYAIVNRGTSTFNDVIDDVAQPIGKSNDMKKSIYLSKMFVENHPGSHITFIGHSKGGAEALSNALANNMDAIVFNPALPNYNKYGLNDIEYTADATSYVIEGEVLSEAYDSMIMVALGPADLELFAPTLNGLVLIATPYVFGSEQFWTTEPLANVCDYSAFNAHGIASVIATLEELNIP